MPTTMKILFVLVTVTTLAHSDSVIQKFGVWPANQTYQEKASLYHGWTNGFFLGLKYGASQKEVKRVMEFAQCLEKISYPQAVATIEKYYVDHPEIWEEPLADMLLLAFTTKGAPCQGKAPDK